MRTQCAGPGSAFAKRVWSDGVQWEECEEVSVDERADDTLHVSNSCVDVFEEVSTYFTPMLHIYQRAVGPIDQ